MIPEPGLRQVLEMHGHANSTEISIPLKLRLYMTDHPVGREGKEEGWGEGRGAQK